MGLSDAERRRLEQIEQGLSEDDPRLAARLAASHPAMRLVISRPRRFALLAIVALACALLLVVVLAVGGDGVVAVLLVIGMLCAVGSFGGMLALLHVRPAERDRERQR